MNWLGILKIVAKVAVATGAVDWAKGWLRKKIQSSALKAERKAVLNRASVAEQVTKVYKELHP